MNNINLNSLPHNAECKFGFLPLSYHVINYKVKIPKPYKPRNLRDKKRRDLYNKRLLSHYKKIVIKVDYSHSILNNKIYDDFTRRYGTYLFKR